MVPFSRETESSQFDFDCFDAFVVSWFGCALHHRGAFDKEALSKKI